MFLGLGKEAISIMFAIFSVGVTIFASSPQFIFDNGEESNQLRKLNFVNNFDMYSASFYDTEKFILYNADLATDERTLKYGTNLDYRKSIEAYHLATDNKIVEGKNFCMHIDDDEISLHLAIIPVLYNAGNEWKAKSLLQCIKNLEFIQKNQNTSIRDIMQNEVDHHIYANDLLLMKYWYVDYTINKLREFPGCDTQIFNNKWSPFGDPDPKKDIAKCTHKELKFIDQVISDLNYDSYGFDIGNKHQLDNKIFYQDGIKEFFVSYMNWLVIGVMLIVLVGWTTITNKGTVKV